MVVVEAQKGLGGEVENVGRRGRPDRARHRQNVLVAKGGAVAASLDVLAERPETRFGAPGVAGRMPIETGEVGKHAPKVRPHEVRPLAEEPGEPRPRIFDPAAAERHGERHVRGLALNSQDSQKLDKIGISGGVEDDETSVDRKPVAADRK